MPRDISKLPADAYHCWLIIRESFSTLPNGPIHVRVNADRPTDIGERCLLIAPADVGESILGEAKCSGPSELGLSLNAGKEFSHLGFDDLYFCGNE
jgi:hypothetical protein